MDVKVRKGPSGQLVSPSLVCRSGVGPQADGGAFDQWWRRDQDQVSGHEAHCPQEATRV